jgi:hypothetical protein
VDADTAVAPDRGRIAFDTSALHTPKS